MSTIALILLVAAAVLFALAAVEFPWPSKLNYVAGGLFFALVGILVERIP